MRLSPHLTDNVVFERFKSGEELVHVHLPGDNQTQVVGSVELAVVGSHLSTTPPKRTYGSQTQVRRGTRMDGQCIYWSTNTSVI